MMITTICLKKTFNALWAAAAFSFCTSVHAWSLDSYELILATAELRNKELYDRVHYVTEDGQSKRLIDHWSQGIDDIKNAYRKKNKQIPQALRYKDNFFSNKSAFVLRSGGFQNRDMGQLGANYKALTLAFKEENDKELKLRLLSLLMYLRASAYFPNNIVTYRDSRAFFDTDLYGYKYCLGQPKRKITKCGDRNLHNYMANLLAMKGVITDDNGSNDFNSIERVITNSANLSVLIYQIKPGTRVSNKYQQRVLSLLNNQANHLISDIHRLWGDF